MFIPKKTETLVLPTSSQKLMERLDRIVYTFENKKEDQFEKSSYLFTGTIDHNDFILSLKLQRPDNFIPLITGKIEDTSKGSIVFIKYTLFKSTRMFLVFWTVLIFLLAIVLIAIQGKVWYGSVALMVSLANYSVTVINFRRKVKLSQSYLKKVFF